MRKVLLGVVGVAVLCLGLYTADALGGNKKKTGVVVESTSVLIGKQNVKAIGHLNTANVCKPVRAMRLFVTDANGVITQGPIDSASTDASGSWKLSGKLAHAPTATEYLQVKAKKRVIGKTVCKAGLSPLIVIK